MFSAAPSIWSRTVQDREVALIGMGEHFELWDRSTLEAREREALAAELDAADFSF